jgi:hypothetical protein
MAVAAVDCRDKMACCVGFEENGRCCLKGVTTALPVVEFPLMLPAVITTSLTVPELPVLSTGNIDHTKQTANKSKI